MTLWDYLMSARSHFISSSVSSWSSVFSCVRTSVINVNIRERMWTVWDGLVLHGQLVGHWLVHLGCILQYNLYITRWDHWRPPCQTNQADKCLFDLEDKVSLLSADTARREGSGGRTAMIYQLWTEPTRDGFSGSGVESLPQRSWTRLLNLLLILLRLFMSYTLDSDRGMLRTKSLKQGSFS